MSNLSEIVDSLENKVDKLITKYENVKQVNLKLEKELIQEKQNHSNTMDELQQLKDNFESLKIASSMLGSDHYKRETKLKINSLIREIDVCITQISDS